MATGVVTDLWRWPVLGMLGEQLISTRVDARGVAGDRMHLVLGPHGPLTTAAAPRLGRWRAGYPFTPDGALEPDNPPYPNVTHPRGDRVYRWGDPRLGRALERDLGFPVQTVRDLSSERGVIVATELPRDPSRSGVNLQLELEPPPDAGWAGRVLAFEHGAALELVASAATGPGIEARVIAPGRIGLRERVALG
jgi:MOSC domain-containing protein